MNEKIAYSIIKNRPNPLLLCENKCSNAFEFILDYIKSINCKKSDLFCNQCIDCQRINDLNYFDLYVINGFDNSVSKEEVSNVLNSFSYTSLEEKGNKFLVLLGIENCNKFVLNSLLKSLEFPPKNSYFIFVTRNANLVLSTIKSRCSLFTLKSDLNKTKEILFNKKIEEQDMMNLCNLYFSTREMIENYNSGKYQKHMNIINSIYESINNFPLQKKVLAEFKKLDYTDLKIIINFISINKNEKVKTIIYYLIDSIKYKINKTLIFSILIDTLSNR